MEYRFENLVSNPDFFKKFVRSKNTIDNKIEFWYTKCRTCIRHFHNIRLLLITNILVTCTQTIYIVIDCYSRGIKDGRPITLMLIVYSWQPSSWKGYDRSTSVPLLELAVVTKEAVPMLELAMFAVAMAVAAAVVVAVASTTAMAVATVSSMATTAMAVATVSSMAMAMVRKLVRSVSISGRSPPASTGPRPPP
jgi:fucose 4-O-acetylase-like acetyltransferase